MPHTLVQLSLAQQCLPHNSPEQLATAWLLKLAGEAARERGKAESQFGMVVRVSD